MRLTRVVDDDLSAQMAQFVTFHVLRFHRDFEAFRIAQVERRWDPPPPVDTANVTVGIMGYGAIARHLAPICVALGMTVLISDPFAKVGKTRPKKV